MGMIEQHCLESLKMFGDLFDEVHLWLDESAGSPEYGYRHLKKRLHEAGRRQAIALFDKKDGDVAKKHIMSDLRMECIH